jgi:hypothetical protein
VEWEEEFSRKHPLNSKIKDTDLFHHCTSLKNYLAIKSSGFLLRNAPVKNYSISLPTGICFEKYIEHCVAEFSDEGHWKAACRTGHSKEGVILQITGEKLKKLECPIYADWNDSYPMKYDSEGIPIDVDTEGPFLSIIIVDRDIPFIYLKVSGKVPFRENDRL